MHKVSNGILAPRGGLSKKEKVGEEMKYIVLWESKLEYMDKVIAKANNISLEREKDPDKYPKFLFPSHYMGDMNLNTGYFKGFAVLEATQEQFNNWNLLWLPEFRMKWVPIDASSKLMELYTKMKK